MRIFLILFLFIFGFYSAGFSQVKYKENKMYKIWVTLDKAPYKHKGYFHHLSDSSMFATNSFSSQEIFNEPLDLVDIGIKNIEIIKIRRKGSVSQGALIGGLSGFVIGSIIAITNKKEGGDVIRKFGFYAVPLTTIGAGIGILFGAKRTKIKIKGKMSNFNTHRKNLEKISLE